MDCKICDSTVGKVYVIREMMFGLRHEFRYFECESCGCVQLMDPPPDIATYYPSDYYSFGAQRPSGGVKERIRRLRNRGTFAPRGIIDRALATLMPGPGIHSKQWVERTHVTPTSRILDVGCGSGTLLRELAESGFTNLRGVDRFIERDTEPAAGVRIQRGTIDDVAGTFDLIMMHHSFEHMDDPHAVLASVASHLAEGGWCLIRIPTASSWAWEHYREHWVQLDAPRHFFLHTERSMKLLADDCGLKLAAVVDDSSAFQFAGSELYRRDLPLTELSRVYTKADLRAFERRARALNEQRRGDQAAFYLQKAAAGARGPKTEAR